MKLVVQLTLGLLLFAATACGDDDGDTSQSSGGGGGQNQAAVTACLALADVQLQDSCPASLADFFDTVCTTLIAAMPPDCAEKGRVFFECGQQMTWNCGASTETTCDAQAQPWFECSGQTN